jgi:hypothetical protein
VTYSVWDNHLYQLKQTMLNKRAVELVYCTNKAHKLINENEYRALGFQQAVEGKLCRNQDLQEIAFFNFPKDWPQKIKGFQNLAE